MTVKTMAENTIKDFVKKQTTPLNIGVPRQRPQESVQEIRLSVPEPAAEPVKAVETIQVKNPVGRPRSEVRKVKMSVEVTDWPLAQKRQTCETRFAPVCPQLIRPVRPFGDPLSLNGGSMT